MMVERSTENFKLRVILCALFRYLRITVLSSQAAFQLISNLTVT